jgi:pyruvate carboxylase subunit B
MPGGALTANTQMMRDNNCLELYPQVIREMREVVAKGGFGTSVTPVSQFYFQQAFANVTQGKWKKITDGYGKMVLGYFGRTPAEPDQEIVRLASEQLGLKPTAEDVHDINDRNPKLGIKAATEKLQAASLPVTDENIFIAATCEDKGIEFLKGNCVLGIRYKADEEKKSEPAKVEPAKSGPACYVVNVEGRIFNVQVAESGTVFTAPAAEKSPAGGIDKDSFPVVSPMPGTVTKIMVNTGMAVEAGDTVIMLEAMKMESAIKTHKSGIVFSIPVTAGQTVATGDTLVVIEEC